MFQKKTLFLLSLEKSHHKIKKFAFKKFLNLKIG